MLRAIMKKVYLAGTSIRLTDRQNNGMDGVKGMSSTALLGQIDDGLREGTHTVRYDS